MGEAKRRATRGDMTVNPKPGKTHYSVLGYPDKPGAVVVGSGIFTVAMSFTPEGRGALVVVADGPNGKNTFTGLRQRQDGTLESFDLSALEIVDVEHPFLTEIWEAWLNLKDEDSDQASA